jgi:hypothetical protein
METQNLTNEQIANASEHELRHLVERLRDLQLSSPRNPEPRPSPMNTSHQQTNSYHPAIKPPKPDTYDGQRNNHVLNTWLFSFKQYCDFYNLNETSIISTAALWFRKDAAAWWQFRESRVEQGAVDLILTWNELKEALINEFASKNAQRNLHSRLYYLT